MHALIEDEWFIVDAVEDASRQIALAHFQTQISLNRQSRLRAGGVPI